MPFQEDFADFLDIEQGFAIEAKIIPAKGLAYTIRGIFTNDYYPIDIGQAGFTGSNPTFECCEEDAAEIEYGDLLIVRENNYKIVEIKPDGTGWTVLGLERQE